MILVLLAVDSAPDLPLNVIFLFVCAHCHYFVREAADLPLSVLEEDVHVAELPSMQLWVRIDSENGRLSGVLDDCSGFEERVIATQTNAEVLIRGVGLVYLYF